MDTEVHILATVSKEHAEDWLRDVGKATMRKVPLHEAKDDLSKYAEKEEIIITRRGKPAGVLIGFSSEDDWF